MQSFYCFGSINQIRRRIFICFYFNTGLTAVFRIIHGSVKKAKEALIKAHTLLKNISQYAEQLSQLEIWRHILSAAMRFFIKGRLLKPPLEEIGVI